MSQFIIVYRYINPSQGESLANVRNKLLQFWKNEIELVEISPNRISLLFLFFRPLINIQRRKIWSQFIYDERVSVFCEWNVFGIGIPSFLFIE